MFRGSRRLAASKAARRRSELARHVAWVAPMLDNAPIGFAVFDLDLGFVYGNRTLVDLFHLATGADLGQTLPEMLLHLDAALPGLEAERAVAAFRKVITKREPLVGADITVTRDGEIRHLVIDGYPVIGLHDHVLGGAVTCADVTTLRRLDDAEAEAERLREAAEATHREAADAVAAARAELETEHAALQLVQRAMLPSRMPAVSGIDLAVAYQAIENVGDIGGDWYDAFVLPDGRVAVAIGDVAGHDLRAATVMGQIRNAVRAYAMEDPRPGSVLLRTNKLLMALPEVDLVTAVYGVYDRLEHRLTFARAGHPPPMVRGGTGTAVHTEPRGIILGALVAKRPYVEATIALAPGDAVLLYTDGLVERRGGDTLEMTERLRTLFDAVPPSAAAAEIVSTVSSEMIDPSRLEDDICLLVLRRPWPAPPTPRPATAPAASSRPW